MQLSSRARISRHAQRCWLVHAVGWPGPDYHLVVGVQGCVEDLATVAALVVSQLGLAPLLHAARVLWCVQSMPGRLVHVMCMDRERAGSSAFGIKRAGSSASSAVMPSCTMCHSTPAHQHLVACMNRIARCMVAGMHQGWFNTCVPVCQFICLSIEPCKCAGHVLLYTDNK